MPTVWDLLEFCRDNKLDPKETKIEVMAKKKERRLAINRPGTVVWP